MSDVSTPTDAQSLAAKLARFDSDLTDGERAIFRSLVADALLGEAEVEGYAMQMQWGRDATGIYFQWVSSESFDESAGRSSVDPSSWTTLSPGADDVTISQATEPAENPSKA